MPHPTALPTAADLRLCVLARFARDPDTAEPVVNAWAETWDRVSPNSGLGDAMRAEMARLAAWDGEERRSMRRLI